MSIHEIRVRRRPRVSRRALDDAITVFCGALRRNGQVFGEETRRCPLCGARWRARLRLPFLTFFSFRCAPCRLLSNVAYSRGAPDDERYARIGEPRPLRARTRSARRRAPG